MYNIDYYYYLTTCVLLYVNRGTQSTTHGGGTRLLDKKKKEKIRGEERKEVTHNRGRAVFRRKAGGKIKNKKNIDCARGVVISTGSRGGRSSFPCATGHDGFNDLYSSGGRGVTLRYSVISAVSI